MHIAVVGINYWPEETGIAVFTTGRCEYLASKGHKVTVCTAFPYYPDWRTMDGYRWRLRMREHRNGVDIQRTWIYVPNRVTPLRRVFHEASFIASSFASAIWNARPDVLLIVSPPLGLSVAAVMLSRRWRIPYVFHVADLQPDAAVDLGMLRSGQTINLLYKLERLAYRKASLVSTLTPAMRRKIVLKGISPEKVVVCSDWAEPALFSLASEERAQRFRHLHGLQDRFLVVHAGNMGVKQSLEVVLDAAEHARRGHPQLLFLLVGDGAMRSKLEQSARRRKLENVRFLPILDREPFRDLLAASDVCLVTQQKSVADIVFPSKVLTLLSAGRPVVASLSGGSEVARVVNESGAGIVARPEDPAVLCDAVLDLYDHPEKRAVMGASGRAYARNQWDRDPILSRFEEQLEEVAGGSGGAYVPARA